MTPKRAACSKTLLSLKSRNESEVTRRTPPAEPEIAMLCEQPRSGMHHVAAAAPAAARCVLEQAPLLPLEHKPEQGMSLDAHKQPLRSRPRLHLQSNIVHDVRVFEVADAAHEQRRGHP